MKKFVMFVHIATSLHCCFKEVWYSHYDELNAIPCMPGNILSAWCLECIHKLGNKMATRSANNDINLLSQISCCAHIYYMFITQEWHLSGYCTGFRVVTCIIVQSTTVSINDTDTCQQAKTTCILGSRMRHLALNQKWCIIRHAESWSKGKYLIVAVKGQRDECYAKSNRDGGWLSKTRCCLSLFGNNSTGWKVVASLSTKHNAYA